MKREELKEAIKNNESVWAYDDLLHRVIPYKANEIAITGINTNMPAYELKDLFATKQQAEHYLHHANITRTETLPFLTWEDIETYMKKMESFGLNCNDRVLARIITKDSIYYFKLCKDFDLFTFQLKQTYIGEDLCEQIRDKFPVSLGEATEPNFYKAYDEAVRLFKGE